MCLFFFFYMLIINYMTFVSNPANGIKSTDNSSTTNVSGQSDYAGGVLFNNSNTSLVVVDGTRFDNNTTIKVGSEYMGITDISTNTLTVTRGQYDSTAVSHSNGATVTGVYIGTSHLTSHPDVMVSLKTDKAGLEYFDFSNDDSNWDTFPVNGFNITANIHEFHTAVKGKRYFRLRFENGETTKTTDFKANTYFGVFRQGNLPLNQSINEDSDSTVVRAIQTGSDPNGIYLNSPTSGVDDNNSTALVSTILNDSDGINDSDTTIVVGSGTDISNGDYIRMNTEIIKVGTVSGTSLTSCTRGQLGTTALSHSNASIIQRLTTLGGTTLNDSGGISATDTTIIITNDTDFNDNEYVKIDDEIIQLGTISSNTVTNCTRGVLETTAASHVDGSAVWGMYVGSFSDISQYHGISTLVDGNAASAATGTLQMQFSHDNIKIHRDISVTTSDIASTAPRTLGVVANYYRLLYTNTSNSICSFEVQTMYHTTQVGTVSRLNQTLTTNSDVTNVRAAIVAADSNDNFGNVKKDDDSSLLVHITHPLDPFGGLITNKLYPLVQRKFIKGTNPLLDHTLQHDGGTVSASTCELVCSTSTTTSSIAQYLSKKISVYEPGQGIVSRFTARFGTAVSDTTAIIGVGTPENGLFIGYNGTDFGLLRKTKGDVEIRKLQITAGADGNGGSFTITLNSGESSSITVASSATIGEVVKSIYDQDIFHTIGGGWIKHIYGDSIIFVSIGTDTRSGTYTLTDTDSGVTGTFSTLLTASSATDTWVNQTDWNADPADNTATLPLLDFSKGNVFQIMYQWLGYGLITLQIENPIDGKFVVAHRIQYANSNTEPTLENPDVPFMIECNNKATTSDISITTASLAIFQVGNITETNTVRHSISNTFASATSVVLAVRFNPISNSKHTQSPTIITDFTFGNESTNKIAKFEVCKNCGLIGTINTWTTLDNSSAEYNVQATDFDGGQVQFTTIVGHGEGKTRDLSETSQLVIEPGDIIVFKGTISTASVLVIGLSFLETQ